MNKTLEMLKKDKKELEIKIEQLLIEFEDKYGENIVGQISFQRLGATSGDNSIRLLNIPIHLL